MGNVTNLYTVHIFLKEEEESPSGMSVADVIHAYSLVPTNS